MAYMYLIYDIAVLSLVFFLRKLKFFLYSMCQIVIVAMYKFVHFYNCSYLTVK